MNWTIVRPDQWLSQTLAFDRCSQLRDTPSIARLPRFQRDGAVRVLDLLERFGACLLADDIGLGKTYISSAVLHSVADEPSRMLVVAPASVLPSWKRVVGSQLNVTFSSFAKLIRSPDLQLDFDLVVVDEAHRARNPKTRRFLTVSRLAKRAKMLLVTSTPIHNQLRDIRSLLMLLTGSWFPADVPGLRRALRRVTVRRTRWTVEQLYDVAAERLGGFPERVEHRKRVELSVPYRKLALELLELLGSAFPVESAEVLRLATGLFAKRLESSPAAYVATLKRCRNYLIRALEAGSCDRWLSREEFRRVFGEDPESQAAQLVLPFLFGGLPERAPVDLSSALSRIEVSIDTAASLDLQDDSKLQSLLTLLDESDDPTLVVTCYRDTAEYLFQSISGRASVLLTGDAAHARRGGRLSRREALGRFSPNSQGFSVCPGDRFDLMVATDVIGEGLNLQDAARLIHYDLPWNPMVIEQRCGRIDRFTASHREVEVFSFQVPGILNAHMGLEEILRRKRVMHEALLVGRESDVGLDSRGFLMGLRERLPPPDASLPVMSVLRSECEGWLFALDCRGEVIFVVCRDGASVASARLLLEIAGASEHPPPHVQSPDRGIEVNACATAAREIVASVWPWLEPHCVANMATAPNSDCDRPLSRFRLGESQMTANPVQALLHFERDLAPRIIGAIRLERMSTS